MVLNARLSLLALAIAFAVAVGAWLLIDAPPATRSTPEARRTAGVGHAGHVPPNRVAAPEASDIRPPLRIDAGALQHLPVREQIDQLDARARAGDSVAACRLAIELQQCLTARWNAGAGGARPEQRAERERMQAHCASVDGGDDMMRALEYLLVAANHGNTAAMAMFAGADLNAADLLREPALYHLYRAHAPRLLGQALAAGEPLALIVVSLNFPWPGMGVPMGPAAGIIPEQWNDARLVRALQLRLERELGAAAPPVPEAAEDIERAEAVWERSFAHAPGLAALRLAMERAAIGSDLPRLDGFDAPLLLERCEEN